MNSERIFTRRTYAIYRHQTRRAREAGVGLDYDLTTMRQLIRRALLAGHCTHCGGPLGVHNFSIDHAVPCSRGGPHAWTNLTVCCDDCNTAKGILTEQEYVQLLVLIACWPFEVRANLLARLKAGAQKARFRAGLPR